MRVALVLARTNLMDFSLVRMAQVDRSQRTTSVNRDVTTALVDLHRHLVRMQLNHRKLLADGIRPLLLIGPQRAGADQRKPVRQPAKLLRLGLVHVTMEPDLKPRDDQRPQVGLVEIVRPVALGVDAMVPHRKPQTSLGMLVGVGRRVGDRLAGDRRTGPVAIVEEARVKPVDGDPVGQKQVG